MATRRPKVPQARYGATRPEAPTEPEAPAEVPASSANSAAHAKAPTRKTVTPATSRPQSAKVQIIKNDAGNGSASGSPAQSSGTGKAAAGARSSTAKPTAATRTTATKTAATKSESSSKAIIDDDAEVDNSPVPARTFSGRLLVIGLLMVVITVVLAPNVSTFLQQRAEIAALEADIAAKKNLNSNYQTELNRWDDPEYVKQQARDRVSMLMPGETGYWVYGANGTENQNPALAPANSAAIESTSVSSEPWVDGLWKALVKSAQPEVEKKAASTPAPKSSTAK